MAWEGKFFISILDVLVECDAPVAAADLSRWNMRTARGAVASTERPLTEIEMRKTAFAILGALLIAGSTVQAATAAAQGAITDGAGTCSKRSSCRNLLWTRWSCPRAHSHRRASAADAGRRPRYGGRGSRWHPWGTKNRAAFCRFDMSVCLVHDVLP